MQSCKKETRAPAKSAEGGERSPHGWAQFLKIASLAVMLALSGTFFTECGSAMASMGGHGLASRSLGVGAMVLRFTSRLVLLKGVRKGLVSLRAGLALALAASSNPISFHCKRAWNKFKSGWKGAVCIPIIAACVGWFTNWLAVKMIFLPVEFWGLHLHQYVLGSMYGCDIMQPLGWIGWQGIVPAKAGDMAFRMVTMVTTRLVDVAEVFGRLDPMAVAELMKPEMPSMALNVGQEVLGNTVLPLKLSSSILTSVGASLSSMDAALSAELSRLQLDFLAGFTEELQKNTHRVIDLKELVVKELAGGSEGKQRLSELFQMCGREELKFLVNSGLWFGFLLGVLQMVLWMFWDNPWTLTLGGAVVGFATNWMALKCIFEPVEPVRVGPFVLQGLFLKRQQEVSAEFSDFVTSRVLTSEKIWNNMLHGAKSGEFLQVLEDHIQSFSAKLAGKYLVSVDGSDLIQGYNPDHFATLAREMAAQLPAHIHVLHKYIDNTLGLQVDMRERMKLMTSAEFEQVLHPIFQEDEMTLIISGAVLGAIAGAVQQWLTVSGDKENDTSDGGGNSSSVSALNGDAPAG